jgi:hypothetical protein
MPVDSHNQVDNLDSHQYRHWKRYKSRVSSRVISHIHKYGGLGENGVFWLKYQSKFLLLLGGLGKPFETVTG